MNPATNIIEDETEHILLCYCTYCMITVGKKLSMQNIFLLTLKEDRYKQLIKDLLDIENDFELVRIFLDYDDTIIKSKYVTKYVNSLNRARKASL
jgi:hypothetical protein